VSEKGRSFEPVLVLKREKVYIDSRKRGEVGGEQLVLPRSRRKRKGEFLSKPPKGRTVKKGSRILVGTSLERNFGSGKKGEEPGTKKKRTRRPSLVSRGKGEGGTFSVRPRGEEEEERGKGVGKFKTTKKKAGKEEPALEP